MLQVPHAHIHRHFVKIRFTHPHGQIFNVSVVFANRLGDLGQGADFIYGKNRDFGGKAFAGIFAHIPHQINPALRIIFKLLQSLRMNGINRNAFIGRKYADNTIAR